ncbi:MAG: DNA integrity scanning protein DisA nucleotide-binding domain protein, partial [Nitrospinota bacterium]
MVLEIGAELEMLRTAELSDVLEGVDPKIFEATLSLAVELAAEGREGRPAGALFVLGDTDVVMQYSRQLIINPFRGYPEDDRNILDPQLRETVKEFSSLDGAFIIRGDGTIEAAGRHLNAAYDGDELPRGLGSRHAAAAGITSISKAIAIALSESTGTVNVFKGGRVLVKIEKSPSAPKRLPEHHHHV